MNKHIIPILVILLFIVSAVSPMVIGYTSVMTEQKTPDEEYAYNRFNEHYYPEGYSPVERDYLGTHSHDVKPDVVTESEETTKTSLIETKEDERPQTDTSSSLVGSPWPMYGHDARHTGRSPYSTVDTWGEVWKFKTNGPANSPSIDNEEIIYIGAYRLYAIYPNGTLKWEYKTDGIFESCCPAIDENGIIYAGTFHAGYYLYAIFPNGTLKWKYQIEGMCTSPVIADDNTIIISDTNNKNIIALYPNGTQKWKYHTNHVIYSSPSIGLDGTIYCGSHDKNVYALYPNNGTLKWKFLTGGWIHGSPSVADDGTVYIGSDDGYLYALYPNNGSMKWRCNIGASYASPALDKNGTLYIGVWEKKFYAIYPNGTIKWKFYPRNKIWDSSAAISKEGTIYFGTCDLESTGGKEIIALYPNGTVKWRKNLNTVFSSPAIGSDGTVYIGSDSKPGEGYLNAFGMVELKTDANGPYYGLINQPVQFNGSASGGFQPYTWYWNFGDDNSSDYRNPTHLYTTPDNFTVTLTVTDDSGNISDDYTWAWIQESNDPPDKPSIDGETNGKAGQSYTYTFETIDPEGAKVWYYIEWGDGKDTGWIGSYASGKNVTRSHSWSKKDTYVIRCKAKDPYGEESDWATLEVAMPKNYQPNNMWFLRFLERHPWTFPILRQMLGLE